MKQELIFLPALALVFLTLLVLGYLAIRRLGAIQSRQVHPKAFILNQGDEIPDALVALSNNYKNLLELPLVFYTLTLILYLLSLADPGYLILCSLFVLLRYVHSYFHIFGNPLRIRFAFFAAAYLVLLIIFVRLLMQVLLSFA